MVSPVEINSADVELTQEIREDVVVEPSIPAETTAEEEVQSRNAAAVFIKEKLIKTKFLSSTVIFTEYTTVTVATKTFTLGGCIPAGLEQFNDCAPASTAVGDTVVDVNVDVEISETNDDVTTPSTA